MPQKAQSQANKADKQALSSRSSPEPAPQDAHNDQSEREAALLAQKQAERLPDGKFKGRVSKEMKAVLHVMAHEGLDLPAAAERVKFDRDSAVRAFKRPHVKAAFNQMVKEIRDNAAQHAYLRINNMGKTAVSEHVKLDANKWIAGVDGISPVQKVEGRHLHSVQFEDFTYAKPDPKDVTPPDD